MNFTAVTHRGRIPESSGTQFDKDRLKNKQKKIKEAIPQDSFFLLPAAQFPCGTFTELYLHFHIKAHLREEAGQREVGITQEKLENVAL